MFTSGQVGDGARQLEDAVAGLSLVARPGTRRAGAGLDWIAVGATRAGVQCNTTAGG